MKTSSKNKLTIGITIGLSLTILFGFTVKQKKLNPFYLNINSNPDSTYTVTSNVSIDKMNVLYMGYENPITIVAPGIETKDLIISTSNELTIIPTETPGKYFVNANKVTEGTNFAKIFVKGKKGNEVMDFGSYVFRAKRLPVPTLALECYDNGSRIPRAAIKASKRIFAKKPMGFDLNISYRVVKWEITILKGKNNSSNVLSFLGSGNTLSEDAIKGLSEVKSGSKIFLDATVSCPDKSLRRASMMVTAN
jgi:hypothetical protein